jgi:DNA-binding transcriptional regulator YhcF (GntR family)
MWKHDHTAIILFLNLLLVADRDTGSYECGRFQLAEITGINPNTIYKTLKRLKKSKMITQESNNKYSTISIVNWHKYQDYDNTCGNNKVTTREQQSNNKVTLNKNIRIKELINKEEIATLTGYLEDKGINRELVTTEIDKFINYWTEKNVSGTKERWQLEKTFEVKKRLTTWFNNINKFERRTDGKRGYKI